MESPLLLLLPLLPLLAVGKPHNPLRKTYSQILVKEAAADRVRVILSALLETWGAAGKT